MAPSFEGLGQMKEGNPGDNDGYTKHIRDYAREKKVAAAFASFAIANIPSSNKDTHGPKVMRTFVYR